MLIALALMECGATTRNAATTSGMSATALGLKRKRRKANLGKKRKKAESKHSTPAFQIHVQKD